jgi:hypothetical protein
MPSSIPPDPIPSLPLHIHIHIHNHKPWSCPVDGGPRGRHGPVSSLRWASVLVLVHEVVPFVCLFLPWPREVVEAAACFPTSFQGPTGCRRPAEIIRWAQAQAQAQHRPARSMNFNNNLQDFVRCSWDGEGKSGGGREGGARNRVHDSSMRGRRKLYENAGSTVYGGTVLYSTASTCSAHT